MTTPPAVELRDIRVAFSRKVRGGNATGSTIAVDNVSLRLNRGEILGLVGESGCGKTTLGGTVVGLIRPQAGTVRIDDQEMAQHRSRTDRRRVQMVFQDPVSSLNPRLRIGSVLTELLRVHQLEPRSGISAKCHELLTSVGLPGDALTALPSGMSGGQRQRVSIARALALNPEILVADEITSALDVSIQAQVLSLLLELRRKLGLSILFITHNFAVVRQVCDRVAVMYLGRIVEEGPTEEVFANPQHPYTRLLLASIPRLDAANLDQLPGSAAETPAQEPGQGCRFRHRCPLAQGACAQQEPGLRAGSPDHAAACHFAWQPPPDPSLAAQR